MESIHESPSCLWICMELCAEGSVGRFVSDRGCFDDRFLHDHGHFGQLLRAVNYLHRKRIVHRDLKPDNLLLHRGARVVKICDFNSARQIGSSFCSCMLTDRGTREFTAPELRFGHMWNERVDIWALGLCFYFMLIGRLPFDIQSRQVAEVLSLGKLPSMQWEGASELHQNLILSCLAINMRDRPPAMQLLKHAALDGIGSVPKRGRTPSPQDANPRCSVGVVSTFFIISPACGLLSIHASQQHYSLHDAGSLFEASVSDWKERRDGALQLRRLARSQFEKVEAASSAGDRHPS